MEHTSVENFAGMKIAGFEIIRELGRGNNGVVCLARQEIMDREVACKILLPELAREPGYVDSFLKEARLAARLDHPNIIQAIEVGSCDDYYYFAMEYVHGCTLDDVRVVSPEKMSLEFITHVFTQLASALNYAWQKFQMTHGDIKPGNLMIRQGDNVVKLADLGLAHVKGTAHSEEIMATPLYAAPEIIRGELLENGVKSDLYSFGIMFYELLAGRPPFVGTIEHILDCHLEVEPESILKLNPELDASYANFIHRLIDKNPENRPADWQEVLDFLLAEEETLKAKKLAARNNKIVLVDDKNKKHTTSNFVLIGFVIILFVYAIYQFLKLYRS